MRIDSETSFHHTELGVLPIDWKIRSIRELQFDISDGNYSSKYPRADEFKSIGVPFIRANNIKGLTITDDDMRFISEAKHSEITKGHLKDGDVLITNRGEIGNLAIVPTRHIGSNINAQIVRINTSGSEVSNRYFAYYLQKDEVKKKLDDLSSGSALKQLPVNRLTTLKVIIPSPQEQTAIANALSDVDALIQELEKLIAKKQAIKTATMQQLLTGRTRLPQFAHHPDGRKKGYKPSELGEIPEDWEVLPFNKIFNYQNGKAQEHLFTSTDGYKVISIGNYSESGKYVETGSYIDKKHAGEISRFVLKAGELAMILNDKTAVGTIIGRVILIDKNDTYVMNQRTMRLSPAEVFNSQYLFALINSELVHKRIVGMAKPGTQIYINTDDVLEFQVQLPTSMDEQAAIANIHVDMDKEVQNLERRLAKTRQIKQGMMQELLTGKTRLVKPAEPA
jgi:type I restriction enzyme S subunit